MIITKVILLFSEENDIAPPFIEKRNQLLSIECYSVEVNFQNVRNTL